MTVTAIDLKTGRVLGYYPDAGYALANGGLAQRAGDQGVLVVNGALGPLQAQAEAINHKRDLIAEFGPEDADPIERMYREAFEDEAPDAHLDDEYESRFEVEEPDLIGFGPFDSEAWDINEEEDY